MFRLRKMNGPGFTWPLFMFASALPERVMAKAGKIYLGKPLRIKSRKELLETIKPSMRRHLRPDTGDMPDDMGAPFEERKVISLALS
jgi:hypothetical protein